MIALKGGAEFFKSLPAPTFLSSPTFSFDSIASILFNFLISLFSYRLFIHLRGIVS